MPIFSKKGRGFRDLVQDHSNLNQFVRKLDLNTCFILRKLDLPAQPGILMSLLWCPHNKRASGTKACKAEQTMGSDMFFLLRTAFWLTLVLALIPLGSGKESTTVEKVDPVSAFLAAQATVSDIGGFCGRNPQACETGGNALTAIGSRARDGARIVYEYLDTQMADQSETDALLTGSTTPVTELAAEETRTGTPVWQPDLNNVSALETEFGPVPRPKPRSGLKT
ncbi:DUF5330 domain-containing protein [Labrenzia sp. VG12]|uniref:DUF5330 domain-containing protein n=1 Tax=Labrenzia sp. VG12 TaxID=2021862 RepID=UPI001AD92830|nr:DUF5330 domain-containing protein [Labrenzia sp. VG12]